MNNITFAHPLLLLLLLVIPLMVVWYIMRYRKQKPALQFSSINLFKVSVLRSANGLIPCCSFSA